MSKFTPDLIRQAAARIFTYEELVAHWCDAMNRGDFRQALLYVDVMDEQVMHSAET